MGNEKVQEFPDVSNKLGAPSKKSLFERQKAEAEAKRLKEQQETAAVYEDFVKSFDDEGEDDPGAGNSRGSFSNLGSGPPGGLSRRHFTAGTPGRGGKLSGPGSLGPPQSSLTRKRTYDGGPPARDSSRGMFAFEDDRGPSNAKPAFQTSDDEDEQSKAVNRAQERAAQKPTLHLSSLPPGSSPVAIKAIIPDNVKVDGVRLLQGSGSTSSGRQGQSAIVTVAADTPAGDLDTVVSTLQNKYLGRGFYLSLSRHLSSAVVGALPNASTTASLPFGAKPAQLPARPGFPGHQRGGRGGFAPPPSYGSQASYNRPPPVHVSVTPPTDLKQLKLIHKTIESLIKHGPEFEALLMSRPTVQLDEKWAWIWDPTSIGGVWYRWRLWDILTSSRARQKSSKRGANDGQSQIVFSSGAPWTAPERVLPFEYSTRVDEFVSDSDYNSSSDEDSGDEGRRRLTQLQGGGPINLNAPGNPLEAPDEVTYLNPLHKAKLVHLLSRLPDTTAKLRRGDVARVTAFAIQHAGEGAEEVAALLAANIKSPLSLAAAQKRPLPYEGEDEERRPAGLNPDIDSAQHKLIALYLLSDILSSSSTSGVRHAWRYRTLFENALKTQRTFAHLGRLEKELAWGRLRAEKWRRSVNAVLGLWEGWCVFAAAAQEGFVTEFEKPPLSAKEEEEEESKRREENRERSKWKAVKEREAEARKGVEAGEGDEDGGGGEDVDGEPMEEDLDGEPMEDLDGEPMDEDVDGEAMEDEDKKDKVDVEEKEDVKMAEETREEPPAPVPIDASSAKRRRPKAEDMFADSDGE
ncbi:MAG: hypothetical protein MMC23_001175 [Stictis urceolatum]|nr:hypothetical protein [Stictis urceolata]